jgi:hypothetical protein
MGWEIVGKLWNERGRAALGFLRFKYKIPLHNKQPSASFN